MQVHSTQVKRIFSHSRLPTPDSLLPTPCSLKPRTIEKVILKLSYRVNHFYRFRSNEEK
ncbi:MAG: hypothetical protein F6K65_18945 [Moorea sp. SIO3C2]|nr:hypothetical protein [Moorena sp. SIO3C2]